MIKIWNKLGNEYRRVGHKSGSTISKTRVFGKFTDLWEGHTACDIVLEVRATQFESY